MQRVNSDLMKTLGADALSPGRMQLMMVLWASKEPVPQSQLVKILQVSRPSVSELLETLSREGMVETRSDPRHGRRVLVLLTVKGRDAARAQLHSNADHLRTLFAGLSLLEQQQLKSMLQRLVSSQTPRE